MNNYFINIIIKYLINTNDRASKMLTVRFYKQFHNKLAKKFKTPLDRK